MKEFLDCGHDDVSELVIKAYQQVQKAAEVAVKELPPEELIPQQLRNIVETLKMISRKLMRYNPGEK